MRLFYVLSFILFSSPILFSQQLDLKQLKGISPRSIGPSGMSGRVTSIDAVHAQPEIIYIGTASGGVWKSKTGGIDWEPIFDDQDVCSIGAIAINQQNPSEIWVGTGEGNPRNSHNSGKGVYRSLDAGQTWKFMGLEATKLIHRIFIHPNDPNTIFVGALGSAWGENPERGVFKTTDGGQTWKKVLYVNEKTGCGDLVMDPNNPNKLIAGMWEFGRKPYTFNSGGPGSGIYITHDGGNHWEKIKQKHTGLPEGDLGRIGLAIAPSKPDVIYALIEAKKNAFYASTDGGQTWEKRGDKGMGNRPFYYADIFVDPENENRIYSLHSTITWSEDGGKNWETLVPYSGVHPDHHALWIHPDRPNYMIEGNDGGLNISHDKGKTWRFIENIPLAQYYHINYDMDYPYNVYGGMQDNGSWKGPSSVWKYGGIRNEDFREVMFGDGFDVIPDPKDSRYGYAMSQGGNISRYDSETGNSQFIKPIHPDGISLRFNWNAAIAQDPNNDAGLYFGSQFVHHSTDSGNSWRILSPDLTTNDTTKQKQAESGGLTIDATQAENYTTITAITPSPVDDQVIWVGTDDGNLQLTIDGGKNWKNLASKLPDCPAGSWIPQIVVSDSDAGEAFVVVNNYRRNDWTPYVYHTKDFGKKWNRIADGNKVSGYCRAIVQDPVAKNLLWLGTDHGLYLSIDSGKNWNKWMNDFPSVNTSDLKIHPREHDLIIGTFGRAAYIFDDIRPFQSIAQTEGKVLQDSFAVFNSPDAYLTSYRSVDGVRFGADGIFNGENRRRGALLTAWILPKEALPKKPKDLKDKLKIKIVNSNGDTIRDYSRKVKPGMNRFTWNLREDGVRSPSWAKVKKDANTPSGINVLPGAYSVILKYKDWEKTTSVTVRADPRVTFNKSDVIKKREALSNLNKEIERAHKGFEQLKTASANIKKINGMLSELPDSTQKEIQKLGKEHQKKISELTLIFTNPQDFKGIDSVTSRLTSKMWRAYTYISTSTSAPGGNANVAQEQFTQLVNESLEKINNYISNDWIEYEKLISDTDFQLLVPLEIN